MSEQIKHRWTGLVGNSPARPYPQNPACTLLHRSSITQYIGLPRILNFEKNEGDLKLSSGSRRPMR